MTRNPFIAFILAVIVLALAGAWYARTLPEAAGQLPVATDAPARD
jgi:hypothetical protein